jgi:AbrB family looped-hinge helix DNA binding protein
MFFISMDQGLWEDEEIAKILVRLDKKGRLVLPLEIRDAINIRPGQKIILSFGPAQCGIVRIEVAKAPEGIESCAYSRNGAYVRKTKNKRCRDEKE